MLKKKSQTEGQNFDLQLKSKRIGEISTRKYHMFLKKDSCTSTSESSEEKVQRAKGKLQDYFYPESHV